MNEYVTILFEILISIAIALCLKYLIPYFKALTENEKYRSLADIIDVAVNAAEQTYRESGMGKIKKAEVIAFISSWLKDHDMNVTEDTIDRLIEAAVRAMKNYK